MAHLTNFSFELFYKIFTEDASQPLLYHGAKKSKMTKNSNQGGGGPALRCPETLFISHEHANFLFSVFRMVQVEAKTPKIMGCCRAIFAFLHALKIGTFRGKWTLEWVFKTSQWGLFIKMATDWQVSEVGDTCRAAARPGRRRSVTFCRNCAYRVSRAFECPPLAFPRNKDE